MIGFGFTIFQFFEKLREGNVIAGPGHSARNFGIALVALGIVMLIGGIGFHTSFMIELRRQRGHGCAMTTSSTARPLSRYR